MKHFITVKVFRFERELCQVFLYIIFFFIQRIFYFKWKLLDIFPYQEELNYNIFPEATCENLCSDFICENEGKCIILPGPPRQARCSCAPGYHGQHCEIFICDNHCNNVSRNYLLKCLPEQWHIYSILSQIPASVFCIPW